MKAAVLREINGRLRQPLTAINQCFEDMKAGGERAGDLHSRGRLSLRTAL